MLAEASIARLAEMGIDAFVLRAQPQTHAGISATFQDDRSRLVTLVAVESLSPNLRGDIKRALRMSGCNPIVGAARDMDAIEHESLVIVFEARPVDALRSTGSDSDKKRLLVLSEANHPARGAAARREFWGALKRLIR